MADPSSTGGIQISEIAAFMAAEPLPPTSAGSSPSTRFIRNVAALVDARSGVGEGGQFSVFLLSEALYSDIKTTPSQEVPLLSNGHDEISDRIWITTAKLGTAYSLSFAWSDQATLYEAIRDGGLGDLPALVVDWRGAVPVGRIYGLGLNQADEQEGVIFERTPIGTAELRAVIHRFWEKSLRTPGLSVEGHAMKVWATATKGVPAARPEERIHGRLLEALKAKFARHDMRAEPPTDDGRIDILIWSVTVSGAGEPVQRNEWVIELKALADRTSTGSTVAGSVVTHALQEGLAQAVAYRARVNALRAALCCFDMRQDDLGDATAFKPISTDAQASKVELWRWYLYRSTSAARRATTYTIPA